MTRALAVIMWAAFIFATIGAALVIVGVDAFLLFAYSGLVWAVSATAWGLLQYIEQERERARARRDAVWARRDGRPVWPLEIGAPE